jgi:hypothetical protein
MTASVGTAKARPGATAWSEKLTVTNMPGIEPIAGIGELDTAP